MYVFVNLLQNVQNAIWRSPNLFTGYRGLLPRAQSGRCVKLTPYLHLVLKLRINELYFHCLHKTSWRLQGQLRYHTLLRAKFLIE